MSRSSTTETFLAEANVRTTKGLPGVCLIHLGMRVRLATNIEPPYAVQDSAGVVVGIEFDESDLQAAAPHANVVQPGETTLRCMPAAVYVKLDDCTIATLISFLLCLVACILKPHAHALLANSF